MRLDRVKLAQNHAARACHVWRPQRAFGREVHPGVAHFQLAGTAAGLFVVGLQGGLHFHGRDVVVQRTGEELAQRVFLLVKRLLFWGQMVD